MQIYCDLTFILLVVPTQLRVCIREKSSAKKKCIREKQLYLISHPNSLYIILKGPKIRTNHAYILFNRPNPLIFQLRRSEDMPLECANIT